MINTFKNITVSKKHKVIVNDIPIIPGDIVDVIIVPKNYDASKLDLPLAGLFVEYNNPFQSVLDENDWEVLN